MKRMHVHVAVDDLKRSIGFYSALFATQPAVVKTDYAKWMLDDPRVNFAISTRGRAPGLDHLGIQVEDKAELHEVYARLREAGGPVLEQGETACCYAKSEKSWIEDPAGIAWETFSLPRARTSDYGDGTRRASSARVANADSKPRGVAGRAQCQRAAALSAIGGGRSHLPVARSASLRDAPKGAFISMLHGAAIEIEF